MNRHDPELRYFARLASAAFSLEHPYSSYSELVENIPEIIEEYAHIEMLNPHYGAGWMLTDAMKLLILYRETGFRKPRRKGRA